MALYCLIHFLNATTLVLCNNGHCGVVFLVCGCIALVPLEYHKTNLSPVLTDGA